MAKQNYQTRTIAADEIQPRTYAFLKHFHKFPVELAALQAQFEKLQDITNQLTGIPEISPKLDDIYQTFDINENLDFALVKRESEVDHNLNNINSIFQVANENMLCDLSSSLKSESSTHSFNEFGVHKFCAEEVFDEIPDREVYHYPIVNMVVYDEYEDDNVDTAIFDEYDDEYYDMDDNSIAYPVYDSDSEVCTVAKVVDVGMVDYDSNNNQIAIDEKEIELISAPAHGEVHSQPSNNKDLYDEQPYTFGLFAHELAEYRICDVSQPTKMFKGSGLSVDIWPGRQGNHRPIQNQESCAVYDDGPPGSAPWVSHMQEYVSNIEAAIGLDCVLDYNKVPNKYDHIVVGQRRYEDCLSWKAINHFYDLVVLRTKVRLDSVTDRVSPHEDVVQQDNSSLTLADDWDKTLKEMKLNCIVALANSKDVLRNHSWDPGISLTTLSCSGMTLYGNYNFKGWITCLWLKDLHPKALSQVPNLVPLADYFMPISIFFYVLDKISFESLSDQRNPDAKPPLPILIIQDETNNAITIIVINIRMAKSDLLLNLAIILRWGTTRLSELIYKCSDQLQANSVANSICHKILWVIHERKQQTSPSEIPTLFLKVYDSNIDLLDHLVVAGFRVHKSFTQVALQHLTMQHFSVVYNYVEWIAKYLSFVEYIVNSVDFHLILSRKQLQQNLILKCYRKNRENPFLELITERALKKGCYNDGLDVVTLHFVHQYIIMLGLYVPFQTGRRGVELSHYHSTKNDAHEDLTNIKAYVLYMHEGLTIR